MLPRAPRAILSAIRPSLRISRIAAPAAIHPQLPQLPQPALRQSFHSSPIARKGIHPESSDPPAPKPQSHNVAGAAVHITEPTPLTDVQYYEYSEHYLESLLNEVERTAQEDASDLEGEYNAGVLNITAPGIGTFVLNKQPPNKQIWLSSPISGPKRYDWVAEGEGQNEKQGTRITVTGQWIYLRDGSNLTDLLNSELGLNLPKDIYSEELY